LNYKSWSLKIWSLIAILVLIGSIVAIYVYATYFAETTTIPTEGTIQTTSPLLLADPAIIDWGTVTVYSSTTKTVTFTNNGTESEIIVDLNFETSNWLNTTDLGLTLDWNYGGTTIFAGMDLPITFTLTLTSIPEDTNTTAFSFDITITPTVYGEPQ